MWFPNNKTEQRHIKSWYIEGGYLIYEDPLGTKRALKTEPIIEFSVVEAKWEDYYGE